jgi:FtsP/CotA-like multicopper oxidase with cupredoxin domain
MSSRKTIWIAVAALLIAVVALPLALVAVVRAGRATEPSAEVTETGMVMGGNAMGGAMAGHVAPAPMEGVPDATATRGGAVLQPTLEQGVRVYRLVAKPVRWEILPGVRVTAWTYNGTVPGPELRVPYGAPIRVVVRNDLPEPTTVHWHGLAVPNAMDGVPGVTQEPIQPGASFTYEFKAIPAGRDSKGGTFFYHSHFDEDRQVGLGLSGALVIEPPAKESYDVERTIMIGEWNYDIATGETRPAMDMEGSAPQLLHAERQELPDGKSFPDTETIAVPPRRPRVASGERYDIAFR